jgi:hypothetical protein
MPVDEQVAHRANVQQATMQARHATGPPGRAQAGVTERRPQIVTGPFIRILRTPLFAFFVPLTARMDAGHKARGSAAVGLGRDRRI